MFDCFRRIESKLDEALRLLRLLRITTTVTARTVLAMSPELKKLADDVAANAAVEASAVALIQGIAAQLAAAKDDPAAVAALAAQLEASTKALADAVAANTPAAPAPPADEPA